MSKEGHIELFVIEESIIVESVHKIFKPLWDVEFFIGDNSMCEAEMILKNMRA
jgi:hypothetical protein